MKLKCGVEEAGRGPVIGPMVMAAVTISEEDEVKLSNMGVKDSKLLTPKKREELFGRIQLAVKDFKIIVISPEEVDEALNDESMNLNKLEAKTSAELIDALHPDVAILDCPSNNINSYVRDVRGFLANNSVEIIAEHKADVNHVVVGAASILAKVTRDREIEELKRKMGVDFGSGYPSDPKTVSFLEKNWAKHDKIFRKTWASYKKHVDAKKQAKLDSY